MKHQLKMLIVVYWEGDRGTCIFYRPVAVYCVQSFWMWSAVSTTRIMPTTSYWNPNTPCPNSLKKSTQNPMMYRWERKCTSSCTCRFHSNCIQYKYKTSFVYVPFHQKGVNRHGCMCVILWLAADLIVVSCHSLW